MMAGQQSVAVEVFGQHFTLHSDKSEDDVRQIAAYMNQHLQKVMAGQKRASVLRMALMAALTIADDFHTATGRLDVPQSL